MRFSNSQEFDHHPRIIDSKIRCLKTAKTDTVVPILEYSCDFWDEYLSQSCLGAAKSKSNFAVTAPTGTSYR